MIKKEQEDIILLKSKNRNPHFNKTTQNIISQTRLSTATFKNMQLTTHPDVWKYKYSE